MVATVASGRENYMAFMAAAVQHVIAQRCAQSILCNVLPESFWARSLQAMARGLVVKFIRFQVRQEEA